MPAAANPHIPPMAPPPPHQGKTGPPRPPPHHPPLLLDPYPGSGPQRGPPQVPGPLQNGPSGHRVPPLQPPVQRGPVGPPRPPGVPQYPHPGPPLPPAYPEPPRYPGPPPGPGEEGEQMREVGGGAGVEEEVKGLSRVELVGRLVQGEAETRDLRLACLSHTSELRHLRHAHTRLTDDNQELRDLCCFLDDDRQKGRKLAREWQRFGRYTASVMRQEVTAYQNKLRELEAKQQELIKDNLELKELCLYLDEERSNAACGHCGNPLITRDDGDGSSSSTNADEPSGPPQHHPPQLAPPPPPPPPQPHSNTLARSPSRERLLEDTLNRQRSPMNEQVLSYIRSLEARVMLLEAEKQQLPLPAPPLAKPDRVHPEGEGVDGLDSPLLNPQSGHLSNHPASILSGHHSMSNMVHNLDGKGSSRPPHPPPYSLSHHLRAVGLGLTRAALGPGSAESEEDQLDGPPPLVHRPNSVAAAMRVLEVQEQLESPPQPPPAPLHLPPPPPSSSSSSGQGGVPPGGRQDADLADGEKALLRQMCSVVWKKLEEVPTQNR